MQREDGRERNGTRTLWAGLLTAVLLAGSIGAIAPSATASEHGPDPVVLCEGIHDPTGGLVSDLTPDINDCWDYGDAPDSADREDELYTSFYTGGGAAYGWFPTLADTVNDVYGPQPGARHRVVDVGWLGNVSETDHAQPGICTELDSQPPTREHDADTFPDEDLTITNLDPNDQTPDHDGQDDGLYPTQFLPGQDGDVRFRVSSDDGIRNWHVNVLADWDFDARWDHEDEWIVRNHRVSVPPQQSCDFEAHVASSLVGNDPGTPWTRITLTREPVDPSPHVFWDGSVPPGYQDDRGFDAFQFGETEDYCGRLTVGNETDSASDEPIRCQEEAEKDDCSDPTMEEYTIDISTGRDADGKIAFGNPDDDWDITQSPGGNWNGDARVATKHPAWAPTSTGRWINPTGNGGNWFPQGFYLYEASFAVNDPAAQWVRFNGMWSRDDFASPPQSQGFQYREAPGNWQTIAAANGHGQKDPFLSVDGAAPGDDVESTYHLRVGVHNALGPTGLLVEGELVVYCDQDPLP